MKDTLQNSSNEGHEMKAAFPVSFELRQPSVTLDDSVFQGEVKIKKSIIKGLRRAAAIS